VGVEVRHETITAGSAVRTVLNVHEIGGADELAECGAHGDSSGIGDLSELVAAVGIEFKVEWWALLSTSGAVFLVGHSGGWRKWGKWVFGGHVVLLLVCCGFWGVGFLQKLW